MQVKRRPHALHAGPVSSRLAQACTTGNPKSQDLWLTRLLTKLEVKGETDTGSAFVFMANHCQLTAMDRIRSGHFASPYTCGSVSVCYPWLPLL